MIDFGGKIYIVDIDVLENVITGPVDDSKIIDTQTKTYLDGEKNIVSVEITEISSPKVREINAAKYELLRLMLDVIMDNVDSDDVDETLGAERGLQASTFSFKLAFNTLYEYGILKEKDNE